MMLMVDKRRRMKEYMESDLELTYVTAKVMVNEIGKFIGKGESVTLDSLAISK